MRFRNEYKNTLALQVMFTEDNQDYASEIAALVKKIKPDIVEINTPTRPCRTKALSKQSIAKIKKYFRGLPIVSVYDRVKPKDLNILGSEASKKRRGK